jgi:hypothetical protein
MKYDLYVTLKYCNCIGDSVAYFATNFVLIPSNKISRERHRMYAFNARAREFETYKRLISNECTCLLCACAHHVQKTPPRIENDFIVRTRTFSVMSLMRHARTYTHVARIVFKI